MRSGGFGLVCTGVSESKGDFERIYEARLFCLHSNECRLALSGIVLVVAFRLPVA